jgi:hypothetical protein
MSSFVDVFRLSSHRRADTQKVTVLTFVKGQGRACHVIPGANKLLPRHYGARCCVKMSLYRGLVLTIRGLEKLTEV